MELLQILWDPNPEIFRIGQLSVRWYGLFWALSFYIGYEIISRIYKRDGVSRKEVDKLFIYMAIGSILGARLGHCFFYDFNYYMSNPAEILMIWRGGLASHGGAIGIVLALYYFRKKASSKSYLWVLDRVVIPVALAAFFIRMGNLMNSEIYGHATSLNWGFIFPGEENPKHPTQIYEGLGYILVFATLLILYLKKGKKLPDGFITGLFAILLFTVRFLVEFVKEPQNSFDVSVIQTLGINMGQILSIPAIIAGILILRYSFKKRSENINKPSKV